MAFSTTYSKSMSGYTAAVCGSPVVGRRAAAGTAPLAAAPLRTAKATRGAPLQVSAVIERSSKKAETTTGINTKSIAAVILGGGAGSRLYPLTKQRAKPAVPIGGAYRLIDVPMSNCINSGISKIYIMTQFNSTSLNRHLSRTYNFGSGVRIGGEGFVEVLSATQTPTDKEWFQGTADAVRQYCWVLEDIKNRPLQDILILSGDQLYRMDYLDFVKAHRDADADITVAALACDAERASAFGLMKIDDTGRIIDFAEKPQGAELEAMKVDTTILGLDAEEAAEKPFIASMGIYVFKKSALAELLNDEYPTAVDFGGEIIPSAAKNRKVQAYLFNDYWEDIGTIKSFFEANLALAQQPPAFEFYDPMQPIYTSPRFLPPAKIEKCQIGESIISHGCTIYSCTVDNSVIGVRSYVSNGCTIEDTMLMGSDYYETEEERKALMASGKVPLGIGEGTTIRNAIVDKNARIGKNCQIINAKGVEEEIAEEKGYIIKNGIVVIMRNVSIPDGTTI
mmetsp:Transcript_36067/g.102104  ORF Transcript_36067/g.102104 Transcript_36067/m.102104 type:complete len:508 (+) Transcript_36067:64-1587(+)|eukprot:CAMPEP_0117664256 /NCGR_PEP_ID=MMETSP0804-20121206/9112_1 /TAXON_ID=1074897 /ORGANISM="Tetraselmis astigmatica, Strain CCMP880" /LENGTH=507 /DNA_ID=CAMNT_0005471455 /DNA_START=60 /DNA_END=1583 /DNA_ORIENTATION=+